MTYVKFRYILKSNFEVEISGTVEVPTDADAEDADFGILFEKEDGLTTPHLFVKHAGVDISGRTAKQNFEVDTLKQVFCEDFLFLTRISDNVEETKIIDVGEAYIVLNGADFETRC